MTVPRTETWHRLLRAVREEAGVATPPVDEERLHLLRAAGLPPTIEDLLRIGYPERPVEIGEQRLFPPRESLGTTGPWDHPFFLDRGRLAWTPRRASASAETWADAAAELLRASGGASPFGHEPGRAEPLRYWRSAVERELIARRGEDGCEEILELFGDAHRAEAYRAELERRLHWARLWTLLAAAGVVWALGQPGRLSDRLLLAGVVAATLGLGLGLTPWRRERERLRALDADRLDRHDTSTAHDAAIQRATTNDTDDVTGAGG